MRLSVWMELFNTNAANVFERALGSTTKCLHIKSDFKYYEEICSDFNKNEGMSFPNQVTGIITHHKAKKYQNTKFKCVSEA